MTSGRRRSLAAVWFADIAGYTALSAEDEDGAIAVVDVLKDHALRAVESGGGRVVKFLGDGVLASFSSADGAVRSALELLDSFESDPVVQRHGVGLRVGVHLGEVVGDADGDVFGDGVNLAARIEGQAEPGQLLASAGVARLVRQRRDFRVETVGERTLQGVAEPVELFRVELSPEAGRPGTTSSGDQERTPGVVPVATFRGAAIVVATLVLGGLGWAFLGDGGWRGGPAGNDASPGSVAVLPLDNFTGDEGQAYLVAALHEALISELTKVGGLTVKSRTSVQRFASSDLPVPEIAAELGDVGAVVEGSVFRVGDSLRVTVQLIEADTDNHLWADDYWGTLSGVLQLQTRVARAIASEIKGELTAEDSRRLTTDRLLDTEAVDLYMRGRATFFTVEAAEPSALEESIELYRRALEIEPEYTLAWAGLADAYLVYAHTGMAAHEAFPRAEEAATRAVELDSGLADAWTALADVRFHYDWDWDGAERGFRRALDLNPGYALAHWWYSGLLAAVGRTDEAVDEISRGLELDPLNPPTHGFAVRILFYARRFQEAVATMERMEDLGLPASFGAPWGVLALLRLERPGDALRAAGPMLEEGASPYGRMAAACALAASGRRAEALDRVVALEEAYRAGAMPNATVPATGRVCLDDAGSALDWLERARDDRDGALPWIAVDPALDPIRDEPRFAALLRTMGLEGAEEG